MENTTCKICPRHCAPAQGSYGFCKARRGAESGTVCSNYGHITSMALDPIEKKPIAMFRPGSVILSVGSYGCNMDCRFCQNHEISRGDGTMPYREYTPEELAEVAWRLHLEQDNIGLAFTYNEPLVGYEFVRDTAKLVSEKGLVNVLVSNGQASLEVLEEIIPYMDAMNIDLKAFTKEGYESLGGDLDTTMKWIENAHSRCHMELTSLIVPGLNDDPEEMDHEARWVASLDPEIPLHITRFFPRYRYTEGEPTDIDLMYRLREVAQRHLRNVFLGNI